MTKEIKDNQLYLDGCSAVQLAKEYGTPLYVMSETKILQKFAELKSSFLDKYPNTRAAYACKAFCTGAMLNLCEREGFCIDVVSGGELFIAMEEGFPPEKIEFNGNNKLDKELEMAIDYGVGRIIVDNPDELERIDRISREKKKRINILFRITPGIKADSHDYIITGKKDSKFGFPADEESLYSSVEKALAAPYLELLGLHFHIGSQLLDRDPYLQALDVLLAHVERIRKDFDYEVKEINLGGGFGAVYTSEEERPFSYYLDPLMNRIQTAYEKWKLTMPTIVVEPGRSIVAEAGTTLYTVGSIKDIKGVRTYAAVDGGMQDNIRPALYQSEYAGMIANKADMPKTKKVTFCGKCCESGDILIRDCMVAEELNRGDLLAMFCTGAYCYSMASNYNSNLIPAVVFVKEGKSALMVERQTYKDLTARNRKTPEWK